jgi:hypothetical protein
MMILIKSYSNMKIKKGKIIIDIKHLGKFKPINMIRQGLIKLSKIR